MIIGIDPSLTSTGISDGKRSICIASVPVVCSDMIEGTRRRIRMQMHSIREFIFGDVPEAIYLEGPMLNAGKANVGHLFEMGMWFDIFYNDFYGLCAISIVQPTTLKKFMTGKGNSAKQSIPLFIYKKWGVEFTDDPGLDKAHAYGLHRYGLAVANGELEHIPVSRRGAAEKNRRAQKEVLIDQIVNGGGGTNH